MQMTYRATRVNTPEKGETLVSSREQAFGIIEGIDKKLSGHLSKQERATLLAGRATLYEALGERQMLDAAQEAFAFSKTANTAALMAVALHHFGRLKEANLFYERAYKYPHELGFEIDIGYSNALLCKGDWHTAWPIIKNLKKRMVYAAYLPDWKGERVDKLSVIAEGGFGDIIQNSRYLPRLIEMGIDVTVYLPPFFFEHGFVDLARNQPWYPRIKPLIETPMNVKATGFFDLPAVFNESPFTVTPSPIWQSEIFVHKADRIRVGFCGVAKAFETPLCPNGVYRSLTLEQCQRILCDNSAFDLVQYVDLQKDSTGYDNVVWMENPPLTNWIETAKIIAGLDAVITVDTAVMHLAASMNKPVWLLLSGASDWKFGMDGDNCLWYPNIRIFRNNDFGFENAVNNVIAAINGYELHKELKRGG